MRAGCRLQAMSVNCLQLPVTQQEMLKKVETAARSHLQVRRLALFRNFPHQQHSARENSSTLHQGFKPHCLEAQY